MNNLIKNMGVKHVSFDFWNTLVYPNPHYAFARTEFLYGSFGEKEKSMDEIKQIYTAVKHGVDKIAELSGVAIPTDECYRYLINVMFPDHSFNDKESMIRLTRRHFENFFYDYPPIILDDTKALLMELVDHGYNVSICSNTNFISGETLRGFIKPWDVPWLFQLFSDQHGIAKPHPRFFDMVKKQSGQEAKNILHIGDNPICDGSACGYEIRTLIIKNPLDLVKTLIL